MPHRRMGVKMTADSMEARITQALRDVAREHDLTLGSHRLYGNGDTIVALHRKQQPERIAALLPIDQTLRQRITEIGHTRASLCRVLRADAFDGESSHDNARELCRLGLIGCYALTELLPREAIGEGLCVRVLFDDPGVEIATQGESAVGVSLGPDVVRLLWQFRPADRFARAFHLFHRQIMPAAAQRASG